MPILRPIFTAAAVFFTFFSLGYGQTYDELLSENEMLRHRIESLQSRFQQDAHDGDDRYVVWRDEGHDHDDHGHEHSFGYGHDHGHQRPVRFDYISPYESHGRGDRHAHGHAGHTSVEGYPFLHGIRTEIDFIERALEFGIARSDGADGGMVDETEFELELVWAINNRTIIILGAPMCLSLIGCVQVFVGSIAATSNV